MLRLPPKVVSVLCICQVLAIVLGYALTRSNYKILEYSPPWFMEMVSPRIAWYSKLMLATGPWLLILPMAWGLIATVTADMSGGLIEVSDWQMRIGYVLSACVALFCISSVINMLGAVWGPIH
jgi:hypothetical protein